MVFTDPPYNVRIAGVVGRSKTKHAEFAEASGEQSPEEFVAFLKETLGNATRVSRDGAVHYVCMDWRHAGELRIPGHKRTKARTENVAPVSCGNWVGHPSVSSLVVRFS
jgi:hypothetical protein